MKIIKNIITLILTILTIISIYILIIIININTFFSTQNIQKISKNINVIHEIEKIQNSTATAGTKAEIADIIETAYEESEKHGISKELVNEMFNSTEVKTFFGKIIGNTSDYIINGTTSKPLTSEDFNQLIDENIDKWIKNSKTTISDSKKEVLKIRIKNASRSIIDTLPNQTTIKTDQTTIKKIQFIFGSQIKISLITLIIISTTLIIVIKRKEKWPVYLATSILTTSLLLLITSFIINDIVAIILSNYNLTFLVNTFSTLFSYQLLISFIITLIISIIILIIYKIKQLKLKKK